MKGTLCKIGAVTFIYKYQGDNMEDNNTEKLAADIHKMIANKEGLLHFKKEEETLRTGLIDLNI